MLKKTADLVPGGTPYDDDDDDGNGCVQAAIHSSSCGRAGAKRQTMPTLSSSSSSSSDAVASPAPTPVTHIKIFTQLRFGDTNR